MAYRQHASVSWHLSLCTLRKSFVDRWQALLLPNLEWQSWPTSTTGCYHRLSGELKTSQPGGDDCARKRSGLCVCVGNLSKFWVRTIQLFVTGVCTESKRTAILYYYRGIRSNRMRSACRRASSLILLLTGMISYFSAECMLMGVFKQQNDTGIYKSQREREIE